MYDILELSNKLLPELREIAKELKIKRTESLKKQDLIYKILDQQAIESIEKKKVLPAENRAQGSAPDPARQRQDTGQRRGKRPRTIKPVINRPVESVISVSPDDLRRPDDVAATERKDLPPVTEKSEEKPDLFSKPESLREETRQPRWKPDNRERGFDRKDRPDRNDRNEKRERDNRPSENRFSLKEERKPEVVIDNLLPLNGDEPLYEEDRKSVV
jgi:transcription termination factor Rho